MVDTWNGEAARHWVVWERSNTTSSTRSSAEQSPHFPLRIIRGVVETRSYRVVLKPDERAEWLGAELRKQARNLQREHEQRTDED